MPSEKPPCLFLSHSGADTDAARELKWRILASPTAKEAGLRVWFDKDDLEAGSGWQEQLEHALTEQATAFAVYVGSRGVINWVDREVRVGLSRATGTKAIPFIPILGGPAVESAALPPFAQQFQGVRDPLGNEDQLARLIKAALSRAETKSVVLTSDPFIGLSAMMEPWADRFFGRDDEIKEVVDKLRTHRLLAIVAESGSGKSSLVRAGVVPAFRGGALEDLSRQRPDDRTWHVVVMRPGSSPLDGLRHAVTETAQRLGLSGEATAGLRRRIVFSDPGESAYALRCDLPVAATQTLLVVDQFEEVLTQTPEADRAPFIDFLLALVDRPEDGIRVLLTMRADYFNLTRAHAAFFARLQQDDQSAVYRLRGISAAGLAQAVRKPLEMAGHDDAEQQQALLDLFRRDMRDRPGDLALIQMALFVIWRRRKEYGGNLVNAYVAVNGISGALADEADRVRRERLSEPQRQALLAIFVRLTRLGETGGVTRRIAPLGEFAGETRRLVEDLARDDHGRLLLVGSDTAEIAHEALITQWGWLQNQVNQHAAPIRQLAGVMEDAAGWGMAGEADKASQLANAGDAARYDALKRDHADWLTAPEAQFVDASRAAIEKQRKRDQWVRRGAVGVAAAMTLLTVISVAATLLATRSLDQLQKASEALLEAAHVEMQAREQAQESRNQAIEAAKLAKANESRALAALARVASDGGNQADAVKLALAAWPRKDGDDRPQLELTLQALSRALRVPHGLSRRMAHTGVERAVFSSDETKILSWSAKGIVRLWDAATGRQLGSDMEHEEGSFKGALPYDNDRRILSWSSTTLRLWDATTGKPIGAQMKHDNDNTVHGAMPIDDGRRILSWSEDGTLRQWDAVTGEPAGETMRHQGAVGGAVILRDRRRIASWSNDGSVRLWDAATGQPAGREMQHDGGIADAVPTRDGRRLLTWSADVRLWDLETGLQIGPAMRHKGMVSGAAMSPDERTILSWARDDTLQLWDAATGAPVGPLMHHGEAPLENEASGIGHAAFSDDGGRVLSWSHQDNSVRLWEAATGRPIGAAMKHESQLRRALPIDDKRVMSWGDGGIVRLWDPSSDKPLDTEMENNVWGVVVTRDRSRIIAWSGGGTVGFFDRSGRAAGPALKYPRWAKSAALSRDERHLLSWAENEIRLSEIATGWPFGPAVPHHRTAGGTEPVFTADQRLVLTWTDDSSLALWDSASGRQIGRTMQHDHNVKGAAFSPDEQRILSWSGNSLSVWDAASGERVGRVMRHRDRTGVNGAVFIEGGRRIVSWSEDQTLRLWDASTGEPIGEPMTHEKEVDGAAVSIDGRSVVSWSSDGNARLWSIETGRELVAPMKHDYVFRAAPMSDGRILTAAADGALRFWKAGREVGKPMRHGQRVQIARNALDFVVTRDERRILSIAQGRLRLWDAATGEQIGSEMRHELTVHGAAFTRDESRIISWSWDATIRWWDAATGAPAGPAMDHGRGDVADAVLSRDERRLLALTGKEAWLWDVATRQPIGFAMPALGAMLMQDGRTIAAWSDGRELRRRDIGWPAGDLLEIACALLPERSTAELKERYGVSVTEPICEQRPARPDWTQIERAPAQ